MRACVVAVAVLWPRKVRIDFANRACASIFDGPLVFRGVGRAMGDGRWACAMTDESAVYSVYAKGIFHIYLDDTDAAARPFLQYARDYVAHLGVERGSLASRLRRMSLICAITSRFFLVAACLRHATYRDPISSPMSPTWSNGGMPRRLSPAAFRR